MDSRIVQSLRIHVQLAVARPVTTDSDRFFLLDNSVFSFARCAMTCMTFERYMIVVSALKFV
jgi:L-rhamnose isomerase